LHAANRRANRVAGRETSRSTGEFAVGMDVALVPWRQPAWSGRKPETAPMRCDLKNTVRFAFLALVVTTLSGCGNQNPMGPTSMAQTQPATETAVAAMPIGEAPSSPDPGAFTTDPGQQTAPIVEEKKAKKAKKPRRHP
jgi:hypothetical protein